MALSLCCCMSSRTGATIIGILDIIISVIGIICVLFLFSGLSTIESDPVYKEEIIKQLRNVLKGGSEDTNLQIDEIDDETIFGLIYVVLISVLVGLFIGLFLASILVHGLRTENPQLLKFHLIIYGTLFFLSLVGAIFSLSMGNLLLTVIVYGLGFYFLMVIYYAYLEVRNKVSQRQNPVVKYLVA